MRVAVALRLGLDVCVPHTCRCGSLVDARGSHSFVCKQAPGRTARHHNLNDLVARALLSAGIPVTKEPTGLSRSDGKRPDGLTLIPFRGGKPLVWDVTVATSTADSYLDSTSRTAGAAADLAFERKTTKYAELSSSHIVQPVAVESLGSFNDSSREFLEDVGSRISLVSGDVRERAFLFQRISVCIQRFSSVLLHDSFFSCFQLDHPV